VVERNLEAFENVPACLRLAQFELGAPANDLPPELDEVVDELDEGRIFGRPPMMASMMIPKLLCSCVCL
jgi:hypothetical protein